MAGLHDLKGIFQPT